jgi:hypothetical protein
LNGLGRPERCQRQRTRREDRRLNFYSARDNLEPLFVHCCHCLNCQRQTGSAFVINLLIEAERVEMLGAAPQPVDVPRDDGRVQRIFRCPRCQVAVPADHIR